MYKYQKYISWCSSVHVFVHQWSHQWCANPGISNPNPPEFKSESSPKCLESGFESESESGFKSIQIHTTLDLTHPVVDNRMNLWPLWTKAKMMVIVKKGRYYCEWRAEPGGLDASTLGRFHFIFYLHAFHSSACWRLHWYSRKSCIL